MKTSRILLGVQLLTIAVIQEGNDHTCITLHADTKAAALVVTQQKYIIHKLRTYFSHVLIAL